MASAAGHCPRGNDAWLEAKRLGDNLRDLIRNGKDVDPSLHDLTRGVDKDERKLVVARAVLQGRDLEDGKTLLLLAAAKGHLSAVKCIVECIKTYKKRLGIPVLVKELRASDVDGAPLLFQAVASNNKECFKWIKNVLEEWLGQGELTEQLQARDNASRNIIMHAIKCGKLEDFNIIFEQLFIPAYSPSPTSTPYTESDLKTHDEKGMSLLHIAARYASKGTLEQIVKAYRENELLEDFNNQEDKRGRIPIMHLFRNKTRSNSLFLSEKLAILMEGKVKGTALKYLIQPRQALVRDAPTVLVHAAHGGEQSFNLAISETCRLSSADGNGSVDLNFALGDDADLHVQTKRRGMLLAEAASSGEEKVIDAVVSAIQTGTLRTLEGHQSERFFATGEVPESALDSVREAIESVMEYTSDYRPPQNLFKHAITSRKRGAVRKVKELIFKLFSKDKRKVWDIISGTDSGIGCLTYAASVPEEQDNPQLSGNEGGKIQGQDVFDQVYQALREAAHGLHSTDSEYDKRKRRELIMGSFTVDPQDIEDISKPMPLAPLAGAMFRSNGAMVDHVYTVYENLCRELGEDGWDPVKIMDQIPDEWTNPSTRDIMMYEMASGGGVPYVSPSMLHTITKVLARADEYAKDETSAVSPRMVKKERQQDQRFMRLWMDRLLQVAVERGAFHDIQELAAGDYPLPPIIPVLLERIGDYEESVIEVVMQAITSASNPFHLGAVASRYIRGARADRPMYEHSLRRLQERIDKLMLEILKNLPKTVRRIGLEFGVHDAQLHNRSYPEEEHVRWRLADKLGFVIVQWMLEPSTVKSMVKNLSSGQGPMDSTILRHETAGWHAIDDPLQCALDRGSDALGFINSELVLDYMHAKFSKSVPSWNSRAPFHYNIHEEFFEYDYANGDRRSFSSSNEMMRLLQGWNGDIRRAPGMPPPKSGLPHRTPLPGLQFILAGIIGKPATFFDIPIVRFAFGVIAYTAMLGLFCSCIFLESKDDIPPNEMIFYVFILGLLWREALEVRALLPPRAEANKDAKYATTTWTLKGLLKRRRVSFSNYVISALNRYLFYDSWNILDASTILFAMVALVLRIIAWLPSASFPGISREQAFFAAQWFLVITAPLLFARLLFLSQVDHTLGPMSQIIWTMTSHLFRFSLFVVVIMSSFALAFFILFLDCYSNDSDVMAAFGSVDKSMLTLFQAMLGGFEFEVLIKADDDCGRPQWANSASVCLLVTYVVIMAVLLLNLLIAVLSTAHAEVDKNANEEFHLARSRAIQQIWRNVLEGHLPSPMNLVMPILGTAVDIVGDFWCIKRLATDRDFKLKNYRPLSETHAWEVAILGGIQRVLFAILMGSIAMVTSAILWVISIPWVAWLHFRWFVGRGEDNAWWRRGYFHPLMSNIGKLLAWAVCSILAAGSCIVCFVMLLFLWVRGFYEICEWICDEVTHCDDSEEVHPCPRDKKWQNVWDIARIRNPSQTFMVNRLLKSTTGWDMNDIASRAKLKEEVEDAKEELNGRSFFRLIMKGEGEALEMAMVANAEAMAELIVDVHSDELP